MARPRRSRARQRSPLQRYLSAAASTLKPAITSKWFLYGLEAVLVILVAAVGFTLRTIPWHLTGTVIQSPVFAGLPKEVINYGYLYGNDPWIEYWLSKYLYEHGLGSWFNLTRDNPVTHKFWYPWGRDFTRTSYPFIPFITAATYGLVRESMSLQQWIALIPPIMSLVMLVAGYLYMRMLFGRVAALAALPLLYLVPATLDRTHAGFVEKEGVSLGFLILGLTLFSLALRKRSVGTAVIAGVVLATVASMWGGYALGLVALASTAALIPFTPYGRSEVRRLLGITLITALVAGGLMYGLQAIAIAKISVRLVAGLIVAIPIVWGLYEVSLLIAERWRLLSSIRLRQPIIYLAMLVVFVVVLVANAPLVGLSGRLFFALTWPLRGALNMPPLLLSVAEHAPLYASPSSLAEINILLFLGPIAALVALIYHGIRRGMVEVLPLASLSLGLVYAAIGMVYFVQSASVFAALAVPAILEPFTRSGREEAKRRRTWTAGSEVSRVVLVILIILLVVSAFYNAKLSYDTVKVRVSNVLTSNGRLLNPGWLHLLTLLESHTSPDTVVVTWWDYGYWVTVGSGRATLADGATLNGTQISILGRMLVSDENTSSKLMREFGLKPGRTLVLVHDEAIYYDGNVYFLDIIDIPKSFWMVNIGGLPVDNYFEVRRLSNGATMIVATPAKPGVRHGLLYNLLADAAYRLGTNDTSVITNIRPGPVLSVYTVRPGIATSQDVMPRPFLTHFKPKWIVAYGTPMRVGQTIAIDYVIIAVYEWVG